MSHTARLLFLSAATALALASPAHANLIINGGFEDGNTGFSSNYTYIAPPGKTTDAGTYQITTNANNAHPAWVHMGAQSGSRFLVANGSEDTTLSPWLQTITLTPGQIMVTADPNAPVYYRFQAYIASVYAENPPRLSFEMSLNNSGEWQTLATSAAPPATGTWYLTYADGYFLLDPSTISFRLRNAESAVGGNDFGIDSIYFGLSADAPGWPGNAINSIGAINGGVSPVPEPGQIAASLLLLAGIGGYVWLRRRQASAKTLRAGLAIVAVTACQSQAALIWSTPTNISGDTDVSTVGALAYAYYFTPYSLLPATVAVNSVDFTRVFFTPFVASPFNIGGGNITAIGSTGNVYTADSDSASNPFASLSTNYRDILSGQMWDFEGGGSATLTLQLNNLTIGSTYLAQFWSNESRQNGEVETRLGRITSSGQSVDTDYNTSNTGGGLGQWVTATFTATNTSQIFVFEGRGASNDVPMLNAMQLRETAAVPEPGQIAASLLLLAGLGAHVWLRRRQAAKQAPF